MVSVVADSVRTLFFRVTSALFLSPHLTAQREAPRSQCNLAGNFFQVATRQGLAVLVVLAASSSCNGWFLKAAARPGKKNSKSVKICHNYVHDCLKELDDPGKNWCANQFGLGPHGVVPVSKRQLWPRTWLEFLRLNGFAQAVRPKHFP